MVCLNPDFDRDVINDLLEMHTWLCLAAAAQVHGTTSGLRMDSVLEECNFSTSNHSIVYRVHAEQTNNKINTPLHTSLSWARATPGIWQVVPEVSGSRFVRTQISV